MLQYLKAHMSYLTGCNKTSTARNVEAWDRVWMAHQKVLLFCGDIFDDNHGANWIDNMLSLGMCLETKGNWSCMHHTFAIGKWLTVTTMRKHAPAINILQDPNPLVYTSEWFIVRCLKVPPCTDISESGGTCPPSLLCPMVPAPLMLFLCCVRVTITLSLFSYFQLLQYFLPFLTVSSR